MTTTIRRAARPIREIIRVTRPHQWVKNAAVFAAPVAAGSLIDWPSQWHTAVAMIAFVLASAVTYIVNDISDAEADRLHPMKRQRPIAAGTLSPERARSAAILLAILAMATSLMIGLLFSLVVAAYLGTTTFYSTWLKQVPLIDVATVAFGFTLRVLAGAIAAHSGISVYLLTGVAAAAAFISIGKRAGEVGRLGDNAAEHRATLHWYTPARNRRLLLITELICFGSIVGLTTTIMAASFSAPSIIAAALVLERFRHLVAAGTVDDPVRLVVSDRFVFMSATAFVLLFGAGIYL